MATRAEPQLLEREEEIETLQSALRQARAGSGSFVLLEGAAGIGKTRLLRAVRETAERAGVRVLAARGTELERAFPFALVRQLFEPVLRATGERECGELLDGAARPAGPVVGFEIEGAAGRSVAGLDPSFAALNGLYWLTSNFAESGPLLLAVDDVHWADGPSTRFLRFLLPRLDELPVLVVVAARPTEPGADPSVLGELGLDPALTVLRLAPLSVAAVTELVRAELSGVVEEGFCVACREATGGNPFMLRELLVELHADGVGGRAADAQRVREVAPVTVQRALLGRLARLSGEARRVARAVAVLGDDADPRQVAELAVVDRAAASDAADALAAAGMLEAGRPLRFVHPLVRNAVYADLPAGEKAAAHRQAARLLEADRAKPERVAVHLLASDPDGDPAVVETLSAAARRALARAAPEAAIAYLRRALAEPPDAETRRGLLWGLAQASIRAADAGAFEELLSDASEELAADPKTLMASAAQLSFWLFAWGREQDMVALLERAVRAATEAGDYDLVMRFESLILLFTNTHPGRWPARIGQYERRIAPDTAGERLWLSLRALSGSVAGEPAAAMAQLARGALEDGKIFREQPDFVVQAAPAVFVLLRADRLDLAERAIEDAFKEVRARAAAPAIAATTWLRGELEYARGNVARAEPYARAAVELVRQGSWLAGTPHYLALLVEVLIERGELDEAERELEISDMAGNLPDEYVFSALLHSRGRLRLAQGRTDEGLDDLLEVSRRAQRDGARNITLLPTAAVTAIALAGLGEHKPARELAETYGRVIQHFGTISTIALTALGRGRPARGLAEVYLRGARTWGTPRTIGIGLHCLGVVRGGERGIELIRDAVATLAQSPGRLEHARALTNLGAALRRANRRAEAREPLRAALEIARSNGAVAIAKRAHEELEATGEKLRPLLAAGVESLTPSERRIAGMAAEGHSNRQIAQALFLTIKTVETHLYNTYRKLDITSRAELPKALTGDA